MENLLDVLITNQNSIISLLGLFGMGAVVWRNLDNLRTELTQRRFPTETRYRVSTRINSFDELKFAPFKARRSSKFRPRFGILIGFFLVVLVALPGVWQRVFGHGVIPETVALDPPAVLTRAASNKKLLILIHGWNGDPQETWKKFPALINSDPSLAAFDVWTISYPTFQIRRNLSIRQMARWLNEKMERDGYYEKYDSIYIVAHSMGGLIARELLVENRLKRDNKQYKSLIEIATPHQGADVAGLLNAIGISKGFSDDLVPGSQMLGTLRENWNSLKDRPKTYCLTSPQDNVVTQDSAIFQCDEFLRYPQWGHTEMVKPANLADERYRVPIARIQAL